MCINASVGTAKHNTYRKAFVGKAFLVTVLTLACNCRRLSVRAECKRKRVRAMQRYEQADAKASEQNADARASELKRQRLAVAALALCMGHILFF